ncbi:MAG: DUF4157 domain-containing protein [Pyrinomonadaceae bacterium]
MTSKPPTFKNAEAGDAELSPARKRRKPDPPAPARHDGEQQPNGVKRAAGNQAVQRLARKPTGDELTGAPQHTQTDEGLASLRDYLRRAPAGTAVDERTRAPVEQATGQSLDSARLHTGTPVNDILRALGAPALSVGSRVLLHDKLPSGRMPDVLSHELGHVAQAGGAEPDAGQQLVLGARRNANEQNADALSRAARSGSAGPRPTPVSPNVVQRLGDNPMTDEWVAQMGARMYENQRAEEERHGRWVSSHKERAYPALERQGRPLDAEVQATALLVMQLRGAMFAEAKGLPPNLMERWAVARGAVDVVWSALETGDLDLDPTLADPHRGSFSSFYWSLMSVVLEEERLVEDMRALRQSLNAGQQQQQQQCPGNCHMPTPDYSYSPSFIMQGPPPISGHLRNAIVNVQEAELSEEWSDVIAEFNWATDEMDRVVMNSLPAGSETRQSFEYVKGLLERQQQVQFADPNAVRIPAVFYPEDEFAQAPGADGEPISVAKGIPWQFYLTRRETPAPAPYGGMLVTWSLTDITAPGQPKVNTEKRWGPGEYCPVPGAVFDPPKELFAQLNTKLRFPSGHLYWTMPSGDTWSMPTTEPWSLSDWLTAIGITAAALAIILGTAGYGTPAVIAGVAAIGLSIGATAADLHERSEAGVLTQEDIDRATLSIAVDLASALTLGLGRIVAVSARAARAGALAGRAWFTAQSVATGLEGFQLVVATKDFVKQYQMIQGQAHLTEADRERALSRLVLTGLLTGALMTLSLRGNIADLRAGVPLHIDADVDGTLRVRDPETPDAIDLPVTQESPLLRPHEEPAAGSPAAAVDSPAPVVAPPAPAVAPPAPGPYDHLSITQLRKKLISDPEAAEALRLRYRAMDDVALARYSNDPIAQSVIEARTGFGLASEMTGHGSFTERERYGAMVDTLMSERAALGKDRLTRTILDPERKRTEGGTFGAAQSDIPGLGNETIVGSSPAAGGQRDPLSRFKPDTDAAALPHTHDHAEQRIADQLDVKLQALPEGQRRGTVWMLIEDRPCSACAQGLTQHAEAPGVLRKLSEVYPDVTFEVKNLMNSELLVIKNGQIVNR